MKAACLGSEVPIHSARRHRRGHRRARRARARRGSRAHYSRPNALATARAYAHDWFIVTTAKRGTSATAPTKIGDSQTLKCARLGIFGDDSVKAKNLPDDKAAIAALHLGAFRDRQAGGQAIDLRDRISIGAAFRCADFIGDSLIFAPCSLATNRATGARRGDSAEDLSRGRRHPSSILFVNSSIVFAAVPPTSESHNERRV